MDDALMRERMGAAPVGRLATTTRGGRPHIVPCCFAVQGQRAFTAVDDVKPKTTLALRRIENIRAHPDVSLLVDHYEDDWSELWWVRIDGAAAIAPPGSPAHDVAIERLVAKYAQYRSQPPPGPVIVIAIDRWRAWP